MVQRAYCLPRLEQLHLWCWVIWVILAFPVANCCAEAAEDAVGKGRAQPVHSALHGEQLLGPDACRFFVQESTLRSWSNVTVPISIPIPRVVKWSHG